MAPSTSRNNGSFGLASNRSCACCALNDQPSPDWWHVPQVRPFVPRFWKKAFFAVIVGPLGWKVAIAPLGSGSISNCGITGGVACVSPPISGKSRLIFWACAIAPARAAAELSVCRLWPIANSGTAASKTVTVKLATVELRRAARNVFAQLGWRTMMYLSSGRPGVPPDAKFRDRGVRSRYSVDISSSRVSMHAREVG